MLQKIIMLNNCVQQNHYFGQIFMTWGTYNCGLGWGYIIEYGICLIFIYLITNIGKDNIIAIWIY